MERSKECYQPGETNINHYEAQLRRESGYIYALISVSLIVFLQLVSANAWWYALVFLPVTLSILGFMQASSKFCANYALRGLQNAARIIDEPMHIISSKARDADRDQAFSMLMRSIVIAAVLTALVLIFIS